MPQSDVNKSDIYSISDQSAKEVIEWFFQVLRAANKKTDFPLVHEWCSGSGTLSRAFLEHPEGLNSKCVLLDSKPFPIDHSEEFQQKIEFHQIDLLNSEVKKEEWFQTPSLFIMNPPFNLQEGFINACASEMETGTLLILICSGSFDVGKKTCKNFKLIEVNSSLSITFKGFNNPPQHQAIAVILEKIDYDMIELSLTTGQQLYIPSPVMTKFKQIYTSSRQRKRDLMQANFNFIQSILQAVYWLKRHAAGPLSLSRANILDICFALHSDGHFITDPVLIEKAKLIFPDLDLTSTNLLQGKKESYMPLPKVLNEMVKVVEHADGPWIDTWQPVTEDNNTFIQSFIRHAAKNDKNATVRGQAESLYALLGFEKISYNTVAKQHSKALEQLKSDFTYGANAFSGGVTLGICTSSVVSTQEKGPIDELHSVTNFMMNQRHLPRYAVNERHLLEVTKGVLEENYRQFRTLYNRVPPIPVHERELEIDYEEHESEEGSPSRQSKREIKTPHIQGTKKITRKRSKSPEPAVYHRTPSKKRRKNAPYSEELIVIEDNSSSDLEHITVKETKFDLHKEKESGDVCFSCSQKLTEKDSMKCPFCNKKITHYRCLERVSVYTKDKQCESSHHHDRNFRLLLCYLCGARSCPDCWGNVTYKKQTKSIDEEEEEEMDEEEEQEEEESQEEPEASEDKRKDNEGEDTE